MSKEKYSLVPTTDKLDIITINYCNICNAHIYILIIQHIFQNVVYR